MDTKLRPAMLGLIIALLGLVDLAWGGVYRWIDETGRVQFTDHPPPAASSFETVDTSRSQLSPQQALDAQARQSRVERSQNQQDTGASRRKEAVEKEKAENRNRARKQQRSDARLRSWLQSHCTLDPGGIIYLSENDARGTPFPDTYYCPERIPSKHASAAKRSDAVVKVGCAPNEACRR